MRGYVFFGALCLATASSTVASEGPKALQDAFMAGLRNNDAAALATCYSADATNFPVDSMVGIGPASVRESWTAFFAAYHVMEAKLSQDHLERHGDTAIAWGLFTLRVRPVSGGEVEEMNGRFMDVSRNFGGHWLYVADHASLPAPSQ